MKLCSRLFVLYCRNLPKDDKSRHFDPNFEEVRGGVEPWRIARWKARAEFLLSVIELLFLSLTVEALQGKMCQNLLPSGVTWSQNFRGRPWEHILVSTKLDTFCYLTVQAAPCYVPSFWHNTGTWQTDRQTDGNAIVSTALAMRALRRAVKTNLSNRDCVQTLFFDAVHLLQQDAIHINTYSVHNKNTVAK